MKGPIIFLLALFCSLSLPLLAQSDKKKDRKLKKHWKKEVRQARSINDQKVRNQYPEIGWLSGLWEKEEYIGTNREGPLIRFLILDGRRAIQTVSYNLNPSELVIYKPPSFLFNEQKLFGKDVTIDNEVFYDLWSVHQGAASKTRTAYLRRIKKISDDAYLQVYFKSFRIRDPNVSFEEFYKKQSRNTAMSKHSTRYATARVRWKKR